MTVHLTWWWLLAAVGGLAVIVIALAVLYPLILLWLWESVWDNGRPRRGRDKR